MGVSDKEDREVVEAADRIVDDLIQRVVAASEHEAVVGVAPAGAGKSYAIGTAVGRLRKEKLRIAVGTPTNEQAFALVSSLADRWPKETITFVPSSKVTLPDEHLRRNAEEKKPRDSSACKILVGTLNKLGDAFARGDLDGVDVLLVDEAYQATSVHYYLVGGLAPRHLLMGDSGQLAPFSTAPDADRWRGLAEDPLLTAVEVLQRNHVGTHFGRLPITRRLDTRAVPIARAFYPRHEFSAAVLPGVRELRLDAKAGRGPNRVVDKALDIAAREGWAHVELPPSAVLAADPEAVETITRIVRRLLERDPKVRCEKSPRLRKLRASEIAVAVSHNEQKDAVRAALARAGCGEIVVSTANKLQGLTFEVVVAWHPLAGLMDADEFHLDPGRLCVMLTRHRHACIVVGRAGDRELVEGIPPATPSYVGWDLDPALDGWYVHEGVFAGLAAFRVEA